MTLLFFIVLFWARVKINSENQAKLVSCPGVVLFPLIASQSRPRQSCFEITPEALTHFSATNILQCNI